MMHLVIGGAVLIILLALPALIIGRWTTLMVQCLEKNSKKRVDKD